MKAMVLSNSAIFEKVKEESELGKSQNRWTAVLVASTVIGVSAGIGGLALSTLPWFFSDVGKGVNELGTWLVVAFFPLLAIAAHSLDRIRDADKALRLEYCRKHGLKERKLLT